MSQLQHGQVVDEALKESGLMQCLEPFGTHSSGVELDTKFSSAESRFSSHVLWLCHLGLRREITLLGW
jgi:hypothetical protein